MKGINRVLDFGNEKPRILDPDWVSNFGKDCLDKIIGRVREKTRILEVRFRCVG